MQEVLAIGLDQVLGVNWLTLWVVGW